jgi:hypothetical protein
MSWNKIMEELALPLFAMVAAVLRRLLLKEFN